MNKVLQVHDLHHSYRESKNTTSILKGVTLDVMQGDSIAIMGASGAGKSTLLHILGGLTKPTSGDVCLLDKPLPNLTETERCALRNRYLGFVYQFHHLLPEFTAVENVMMPLWLQHISNAEAQTRALDLLKAVGLEDRAHYKPGKLSGGERQRVAIARALVHEPACVLADEPTGNLDEQTADAVADRLLALNASHNVSLVIATHDQRLANRMNKIYRLHNGVLALS